MFLDLVAHRDWHLALRGLHRHRQCSQTASAARARSSRCQSESRRAVQGRAEPQLRARQTRTPAVQAAGRIDPICGPELSRLHNSASLGLLRPSAGAPPGPGRPTARSAPSGAAVTTDTQPADRSRYSYNTPFIFMRAHISVKLILHRSGLLRSVSPRRRPAAAAANLAS